MSKSLTVYPIYLNHIEGLPVLVVGGGRVGERKVAGLLAAGAAIRVVSPSTTPTLTALATAGKISWTARVYQRADLQNVELVFAATNVRAVNAQVAREARQARILCNVADAPAEGDFHVPAVHRQADLIVAVGTGGRSPSQARNWRDRIAAWLAGQIPGSAPDAQPMSTSDPNSDCTSSH